MDRILVHGLRQLHVDRGGGWFELMTNAIAGTWPAQTPSAGTRGAERGLGITGRPYYFYALRADKNFGLVVFLLSEIEGVDWPPAARGATPFDSGGLWFGMIATDPPLNPSDRRGFFNTHDVPLAGWYAAFGTYIGTRYKTIADYVRGSAPATDTQNSGPAIAMDAPTDPRAWTWEVRVPHQLVDRHLELRAVCISEENLTLYSDWLSGHSRLTPGESSRIKKWIQDYAIVPSPGLSEEDKAVEWIVQEVA